MDRNFWPAAAAAAAALSVLLLTTVAPSSGADSFLEPYDLLYNSGVQAFYSGEYTDVVRYMEAALSSQAEVRSTRVRCRLRCQDQHPFDDTFSELRFFDVVLHRAACMNRCIEDKLGAQSLHKVSEDVAQDFHRRIPYNYLQLAYQKVGGLWRGVRWGGGGEMNGHDCSTPHHLHSSPALAAAQRQRQRQRGQSRSRSQLGQVCGHCLPLSRPPQTPRPPTQVQHSHH